MIKCFLMKNNPVLAEIFFAPDGVTVSDIQSFTSDCFVFPGKNYRTLLQCISLKSLLSFGTILHPAIVLLLSEVFHDDIS